MSSEFPSPRTSVLRPVLLVVVGLAILGAAAGLIMYNRNTEVETSGVSAPPAASQPATTATAPAPAALEKPSFDVVRVNPKGDAVIAGRAAPGSQVTISEDGTQIGQAQADQSGAWVFVPSTPLPPGARTLTLSERTTSGAEANGDRSVVLVVPPPPATGTTTTAQATPPLAVLTAPNAAPTVLTGPATDNASAGKRLALEAAEYDEHGHVRLAGTATPGAKLRLYLDDKPVGEAAAGQDGRWSLSVPQAIGPGDHRVRVDQIGENGAVASRVEQSFSREEMELAAGKITIVPGQNLWTIARQTYGHGIRYLVIFQANRQQIRDPNLIYPGQVFALPSSSAAPAIPASSSRSK